MLVNLLSPKKEKKEEEGEVGEKEEKRKKALALNMCPLLIFM